MRPELVQLRPPADPRPVEEPFGLTWPELHSPVILPPEITTRSVLPPQGVPMAFTTHAPSKLPPPPPPPPPPLLRDARRGSSASGLARRAGFEDSTERGASREPDSDFSSLPMLPPALPDCASAGVGANAATSNTEDAHVLIKPRNLFFITGSSNRITGRAAQQGS
jgi:hypothetical protein